MTSAPHILMVDDEAAIRELYTLYLHTQGFEVTTVSSAVEALDAVYATPFDLAILDVGLGDSNGMDLIEPMKTAQPNLPIAIYTGRMEQQIRKEALARGASAYWIKTYPLNYIVNEIIRILRETKQKQQG
jgi:two-component system, OmpR family, response regulator